MPAASSNGGHNLARRRGSVRAGPIGDCVMSEPLTDMARETRETPEAIARLLDRRLSSMLALGKQLANLAPPLVATCARGSSDHAAGYFKYLLEIATGTPVASIGPSVASVYRSPLRLSGAALVTVSQSGKSPDLVALQASARASGALTIAVVNAVDSPVAESANIVVPLEAGPEKSVAATKSFVASAVAGAAIVAGWTDDDDLVTALRDLPAVLEKALVADWSAAEDAIANCYSLYSIGRGPAYPVVQESALKSKETAAIHAEAFSTAEVMHGPLQLVRDGFPVLAFLPEDAAADAGRAGLERIVAAGGRVFSACTLNAPSTRLPVAPAGHAFLDPLSMIVSFYVLIERVSRLRGFDPDRPANLRKITETV